MTTMRAKVTVTGVTKHDNGTETIDYTPVSKCSGYPEDGSDEDNTYARFSPSGSFRLQIANPNLVGKFALGDKFYVDFTPA